MRCHADNTGRRIWQPLRERRIEFRMKKSNRSLSLPSCPPGPGRSVGSCPAAKFARGPKIRAVPCAQACRRNSTLSESSESFIWRARGVQASQAPPEEGRALTRGVLRNGNEELRRAPEPSGAARSSGGRWLGAHFSDLKTPTTVRAQPAGVAGLGERRQLLLSSQPRCRELAAISTASQSMQNDSVSMRRFLRTI